MLSASTTPGPATPTGWTWRTAAPVGPAPTGLGLWIVARTAEESGGGLALGRSPLGGARAEVVLGPPG